MKSVRKLQVDGIALRFGFANVLLVAGIACVLIGGWATVIVTAIAMLSAGPVDEAAGDDEKIVGSAGRGFYALNLYATAPLIVLLTIAYLYTVHRSAGSIDSLGSAMPLLAACVLVGYLYSLVGVTAAHELTHWTHDAIAQVSARILLAFTFNTSFTIYHVHGHHRTVAQFNDAATARRDENVGAFFIRTVVWQFRDAFAHEAARLRRANRSAWSWRNRAISGQLYSLAVLAGAWTLAGFIGVLFFMGAALVGRVFHELMNYVQHFGLVRAEGSAIGARHTWDCYRRVSNALQYNLPRHSDHHLFGSKPFWELSTNDKAPKLPHGYQTMAMLALIGPLWRRTMRPLLADWDSRLANEAERQLVRQRGWDNLA